MKILALILCLFVTGRPLNAALILRQNNIAALLPEAPPVTGMTIWLEASIGTFTNAARTVPTQPSLLDDGSDRVGAWLDLSGNGKHALQAGEIESGKNARPVWTNSVTALGGRPALLFGVDAKHRLQSSATVNIGSAGCTVFAVGVWGLEPLDSFNCILNLGGAGVCELREANNTQTMEFLAPGGGSTTATGGTFTNGVGHVWGGRFDDALNRVWCWQNNFTAGFGAAGAGSMPTAVYAVGSRIDGTTQLFWRGGFIAEIIVYNTPLTDQQCEDVTDFLKAKYSL